MIYRGDAQRNGRGSYHNDGFLSPSLQWLDYGNELETMKSSLTTDYCLLTT